jgi:FAD/FMN-containing dehydrogenase
VRRARVYHRAVLRRDFLERVAIGSAAVGLGVSCGDDATPLPPAAELPFAPPPVEPVEPPPPPAPPPASVTPASEADWVAFAASLSGRLVRPSDPSYATSRQLYDPAFDSIRPAGIAYVANEDDVKRAIDFARTHGLAFTARSGGHSYAGYSTTEGLVCDVGSLAQVEVDRGAGTATVGAGARLIDVYAGTAPFGLAIPGGTCASVGIAGLALGGGQGVLGRKLGLTCDSVIGMRVATAAGEVIACDERENAELLWACRGSGGGHFGVVTSFTFRTHAIGALSRFSASLSWDAASDAVAAWQSWVASAPDELWSAIHLRTSGTTRGIGFAGCYAGPASALEPVLASFRSLLGSAYRAPRIVTESYLDTMRAQAGCREKTIEECHLPTVHEAGQLGRRGSETFSDIYDRPLSSEGIAALIAAIEARGEDAKGAGGVAFDSLGGAINRVAPDATAFAHRSGRFIAQCSTHWPPRATEEEIAANRRWHAHLRSTMRPHTSGFAYVNYIDPDLEHWERAYYGANLPRLKQCKARYDAEDFFRFAQSIRPA